MTLTQELREAYSMLWHSMVTHPFVQEMGDGTLPSEKFKRYFLQDYIFVRDLVILTTQGVCKAPDMETAAMLTEFLADLLNPENDLFERAFDILGVSPLEYEAVEPSLTTQAFGDFIVRVAHEGSFEDILTVLYVTEGSYMDWATRLTDEGAAPENPIYGEWIELHGRNVLGGLIDWIQKHLDSARLDTRRAEMERIFRTTLRYEYMFWEAAYHGESWPGE